MNLMGARALVTGGAEGIGRAIAEKLVAKGAQVGIMGRRADFLHATGKEIGALAIPGDVAIETDAVRAVQSLVDAFGGIDILVNNAGIGHFVPLVEMDAQRFDEVFATNVRGAMLMAREAAKRFVEQKSGHLINISSTSGLRGGAKSTAYSGSKFALRGMTECWREELRRHNVRVMLVNPSEVQTAFFSKGGGRQDLSPKKLRGEEIAAAIIGCLEIDDRGFVPELSVFATNPF